MPPAASDSGIVTSAISAARHVAEQDADRSTTSASAISSASATLAIDVSR